MKETQEAQVLWRFISDSVDRLVECLDGLAAEDLNWSPLPAANSLYVLATHTMGNVRKNVLGGLCDEPVERDRDAEFAARGDSPEALQAGWRELRDRISERIAGLPPSRIDGMQEFSGRGRIASREAMIIVARHAAEHLGHAELTRDLLKAGRDRAG